MNRRHTLANIIFRPNNGILGKIKTKKGEQLYMIEFIYITSIYTVKAAQ